MCPLFFDLLAPLRSISRVSDGVTAFRICMSTLVVPEHGRLEQVQLICNHASRRVVQIEVTVLSGLARGTAKASKVTLWGLLHMEPYRGEYRRPLVEELHKLSALAPQARQTHRIICNCRPNYR